MGKEELKKDHHRVSQGKGGTKNDTGFNVMGDRAIWGWGRTAKKKKEKNAEKRK